MKENEHLGFHLRTAHVLTRRYLDNLNEKSPVQLLTGLQGWVVGYLLDHRDRDVFQRDLETVFSVRRPTMTRMLQLMEKNGYITRESVEHDARLKKIVPTPKAEAGHKFVMDNIRRTEEKIAQPLTEEEISEFLRIIKKIEQSLDIENANSGGPI